MDFERLSRFERINVVGTSGSGKSTFAKELAEMLNLPFDSGLSKVFPYPQAWKLSRLVRTGYTGPIAMLPPHDSRL